MSKDDQDAGLSPFGIPGAGNLHEMMDSMHKAWGFAGATPVLLGCPPFGISTEEVFRRAGARLTLPENGVSVGLFSAHKWPVENDFAFAVNDLEEVVFNGWPELVRFRDHLLGAGARRALLSGRGSTVFGVYEQSGALEEAL